MSKTPVIVIGAGVAGMTVALKLAPRPVFLVTAAQLEFEAASAWAQGGIAAVTDFETDSIASHIEDTLKAGAGLCDADAVRVMASEVPNRIADLEAWGVDFARNQDGSYRLAQEGAHRVRRVLHAAAHDGFGKEITHAMAMRVRNTPSITVLENHVATALGVGEAGINAVALAPRDGTAPFWLASDRVVLATGGLGGLYSVTTNPLGATGAGIALAAPHGATLCDMEFMQFHPTGIDIGRDPAPLATESLRGDGCILIDGNGHRFMVDEHERAELAPRDVVARGIHKAKSRTGAALLDARQAIGSKFPDRFPTVYKACMSVGIDPVTDPIPVAPAAHFHMGGIETDLDGRTNIDGLYAVGEVASTGVHGANRLASNSLAEAVVFGARAARAIIDQPHRVTIGPATLPPTLANWSDQDALLAKQLRQAMSQHVGVVRDRAGLETALDQFTTAMAHPRLKAMQQVARLMTAAAIKRQESRGGHFRSDFPVTLDDANRARFHLPKQTGATTNAHA